MARGKPLPRLLFFTDPSRTPEALATVLALPRGAGVVYRAFGSVDALDEGRRLARAARARGLVFLVGADAALASRLMADGVHLPQRLAAKARGLKQRRPGWIVTCAAHSAVAIVQARRSGADAVVVSPVFDSASPSAARPLGLTRFVSLVRGARTPVYALGGINAKTAQRLRRSGVVGLAAVEALAVNSRT